MFPPRRIPSAPQVAIFQIPLLGLADRSLVSLDVLDLTRLLFFVKPSLLWQTLDSNPESKRKFFRRLIDELNLTVYRCFCNRSNWINVPTLPEPLNTLLCLWGYCQRCSSTYDDIPTKTSWALHHLPVWKGDEVVLKTPQGLEYCKIVDLDPITLKYEIKQRNSKASILLPRGEFALPTGRLLQLKRVTRGAIYALGIHSLLGKIPEAEFSANITTLLLAYYYLYHPDEQARKVAQWVPREGGAALVSLAGGPLGFTYKGPSDGHSSYLWRRERPVWCEHEAKAKALLELHAHYVEGWIIRPS